MCSVRYILAHNSDIYACVLPFTRVFLLKFHLFKDQKITLSRQFFNIFTLSMVKLNWHRDHMVIASSIHQVLGELRSLFLEGVTRSNKIIWSTVRSIWALITAGKRRRPLPVKFVSLSNSWDPSQCNNLICFLWPCSTHRDVDAKLKDEQTSLAPFDHHMAAVHGSHVSVTHRYRVEKEISQINFCCKHI